MPTYDYRCTACGHAFEEFQSMSAKTLKRCPSCGKDALERLIGIGAGVIFKGSGFYETDYRSESYKKGADADKSPSGGGHVHTDSCGCGQKTKAECAAGSAGPNSKPGEASGTKAIDATKAASGSSAAAPSSSTGGGSKGRSKKAGTA